MVAYLRVISSQSFLGEAVSVREMAAEQEKATDWEIIKIEEPEKAINEQEDIEDHFSKFCTQIAEVEGLAENVQHNKENKNEQNFDSESELEKIAKLQDGNFRLIDEEIATKGKRKCKIPINELQEPKLKKIKCDILEETKEENASVLVHLKRKRDESNPIHDPFFKKPKFDYIKTDEEPPFDNEKNGKKPVSDDKKTDEEPNDNDEKPKKRKLSV